MGRSTEAIWGLLSQLSIQVISCVQHLTLSLTFTLIWPLLRLIENDEGGT